jgi:murein DD-endopeptidase MepM/ murein hydrolase activator NlpD
LDRLTDFTETAVGTPHRFTQDYKVIDLNGQRPNRRMPWFIAGVGIPLVCVAFILPKHSSETSDPGSTAQSELVTVEIPVTEQATTAAVTATETADGTAPTSASAPQPDIKPTGNSLTLKVRRSDSLDRLFKRHGLSRTDLANIMTLDSARKYLRLVKPGDEILVREADGKILQLDRQVSLSEVLSIRRKLDTFEAQIIEHELEAQPVRTTGTIESSLFLAAAAAGISDRTIMNLAGIFAWDVDFVLDIRQGDAFSLVYEEFWQDGERVAEGDILAAEFINRGKRYRAIRFKDASGRVDYYTPEGLSVRKAFVRAPLSFARISSNFNPRRRHPKLNTIRAHKGVDYAAPAGTPIKAAGDGKIILRGRKGGYGNAVIIQHGGNITTLYAHMSRFSKARIGSRVRQGDIIGYVGSTGLATGPHLHYEYRRNGVHLNPRTVKLPDAEPINAEYLAAFKKAASPLLKQLDNERTLVASDTP